MEQQRVIKYFGIKLTKRNVQNLSEEKRKSLLKNIKSKPEPMEIHHLFLDRLTQHHKDVHCLHVSI